MARSRKTIDVDFVRKAVNNYLAADYPSVEKKEGAASVLELVLMNANSYNGFRYLDGWPCDDESRREYY